MKTKICFYLHMHDYTLYLKGTYLNMFYIYKMLRPTDHWYKLYSKDIMIYY